MLACPGQPGVSARPRCVPHSPAGHAVRVHCKPGHKPGHGLCPVSVNRPFAPRHKKFTESWTFSTCTRGTLCFCRDIFAPATAQGPQDMRLGAETAGCTGSSVVCCFIVQQREPTGWTQRQKSQRCADFFSLSVQRGAFLMYGPGEITSTWSGCSPRPCGAAGQSPAARRRRRQLAPSPGNGCRRCRWPPACFPAPGY